MHKITIIIAAVVSGYAGGLLTTQASTPAANFDVKLTDDSISLTVQSISEEIPSKDLTIVLSSTEGTRKVVPGDYGTAGASTVPFGFNIVESKNASGFHDYNNVTSAMKKSVTQTSAANTSNFNQWFGNYTLKAGSQMSASKDAFTDMCSGVKENGDRITLPKVMTSGTLKGKLTLSKADFLTISVEEWESIFGEEVKNGQAPSKANNVFTINKAMSISNNDLGAYLVTKDVATGENDNYKTKNEIYATATDALWNFGQTNFYGDGNGYISLSPGDRVTVSIVYSPSGQTMFTKTVTVKED